MPSKESDLKEEDAPVEQQFRIFDAASIALVTMADIPHEERVSAIATMLALEIGSQMLDAEGDESAMTYLIQTVAALLPTVKADVARVRLKH